MAQALLIPDAISASLLTSDSVFTGAVDAVRASAFDGDTARYHLLRAEALAYRGDRPARARRPTRRASCSSGRCGRPDDPKVLARTGLAYARLGRKADAMRAGRRAAELLPPAAGRQLSPFVLTRLAQIYTLVNEPDQALDSPGGTALRAELDQPRRAAERSGLDPAAPASSLRGARRLALTIRAAVPYIAIMRPETRRNRNPEFTDHAFT